MHEHKILADSQHGSRKRRACGPSYLTCYDQSSVVNRDGQVDMLILDFAKDFDTVAHERLLSKLESYGITNGLHNWIRSFFEGQLQRVVLDL